MKKRFRQRCFSMNFAKFLRTSFDKTPSDDCFLSSEAVVRRCSVKKVFLKISQKSQENACARASWPKACNFIKKRLMAQVFCKKSFFQTHFFYRAPAVATSISLSGNFEKNIFRTPLLWGTFGKLLIWRTSCRISTSRYSKKLFHRCFSSILYQNKRHPAFIYLKSLKIIILKIIKNTYLWRG